MIHRYWSGPLPATEPWVGNVVRKLHPHMPVFDWTDRKLPRQIVAFADDTAGQVGEQDRLRHRANVIRWSLLYEMGGWWADHDLIPLVPFTTLPVPATAAHGTRCTCWLAFPQHHETPAAALEAIRTTVPTGTARSVDVSGENLLERLCQDAIPRLELPFDAGGSPIRGTKAWAVHLYATASSRRRHH